MQLIINADGAILAAHPDTWGITCNPGDYIVTSTVYDGSQTNVSQLADVDPWEPVRAAVSSLEEFAATLPVLSDQQQALPVELRKLTDAEHATLLAKWAFLRQILTSPDHTAIDPDAANQVTLTPATALTYVATYRQQAETLMRL